MRRPANYSLLVTLDTRPPGLAPRSRQPQLDQIDHGLQLRWAQLGERTLNQLLAAATAAREPRPTAAALASHSADPSAWATAEKKKSS